jgi:hypothetical protein
VREVCDLPEHLIGVGHQQGMLIVFLDQAIPAGENGLKRAKVALKDLRRGLGRSV